jgi:hypothetical protein
MSTPRAPGVYVNEVDVAGPISGVGTSTAAFLGVAGSGPIADPTLITNLTAFTETFGGAGQPDAASADLVHGVRGFFENGGTVAYVTRLGLTRARASAQLTGGDPAKPVLTVTAIRAGVTGNAISVEVQRPDDADDPHFTLVVRGPAENQAETFADLSMDPSDIAFAGSALEGAPVTVAVLHPDDRTPPAKTTKAVPLAGGRDDTPEETEAAWSEALDALAKVDEVSLVCAPGFTAPAVHAKLVEHCERTGDRFAILDASRDADPQTVATGSRPRSSGGYGALYYPWLTIPDPTRRDGTLPVPPSGHVAGVIARVDTERGVHKAPANEAINGVLGVNRVVDDGEHGVLNDAGVNVLRVFPGRSRPVVWGARTIADRTEWQYVNVRRLFLFVEESIQQGIRWAVFEPNDRTLWKQLDRTITEFLTRVWSSGALFGATAAEAFYVKIDEENNLPADRESGVVTVEIGIAPVRPAEFVIVRIGVWAGGGQVQEG